MDLAYLFLIAAFWLLMFGMVKGYAALGGAEE